MKSDWVWRSGSVSRKDIVGLYEWLLKLGKIKVNGAAHTRLKELRKRLW